MLIVIKQEKKTQQQSERARRDGKETKIRTHTYFVVGVQQKDSHFILIVNTFALR